jgi:hypothetical protein
LYVLYESEYNGGGDCIYDDMQRPATFSGCAPANQFEWLSEIL